MNIFSQEEPTNLFGGLSEDPTLADVPQADPQASARKGRLAALALEPPDGIIGKLEERSQFYAERIQAEGDRSVREQAAANQQLAELRGLARLSPIAGASPEDALAAHESAALASQIIDEGIDKRRKYALEQEAIKKIQDVAAAGDVVQAKLLLNNLELGDADQRIRDAQTKRMILASHIENAQIAKDQQGWFSHVTDFLLQVIPLNSSISSNNLVDIEDGMKGWLDWLFSGKIIRTQSDTLYNMDVGEFSDYVSEKLIPAVKENSTFWGFENRTEELDLLSNLARAPEEWETNTWNTLDNLGWIPITKLGKVGRLGKVAVNLGARKQYAEAVARAAESIAKDGGETALKKTGVSATEVADNIRPTIVNTGEPVSAVPVGSDVTSIIEQAKAVLSEMLPPGVTERLAAGELDKAVKVVTERAQRIYGDIIKDVSAPVVQTLPDRSNVKFLDITLGKDAGGGFATADQSRGFLAAIGVEGSPTPRVKVPAPAEGFTRLYRGETGGAGDGVVPDWIKDTPEFKATKGATGRWFTPSEDEAKYYNQTFGDKSGRISYVDVPTSELGKYKPKGEAKKFASHDPKTNPEYFLPKRLASSRRMFNQVDGVVQDQSGQWFAKIRVPIPESGFYTNLLNVKATNSVARAVLSSRLLEDTIMSDWSILSGNARNQTKKALTDYYVGKVGKLGSSEKLQLAEVLAKGTNESKWYSRDHFDVLYERAYNRLPAEKEWEAYNAVREVQDLSFVLRNSDIYKTKFSKGFQTVSFDIPGSARVNRVNALVDQEMESLPRTRVYVVDEGVHFTHTDKAPIGNQGAGRRMGQSDLAGYKSKGYTLFSLEKPHKLADGTEIQAFLAKQHNIENLRIDQLGYKEGSNRFYKGDYYVKQTHWGVQPDTGSKFLKNPRVFINGSRAELVQWTKTMNAARLAAKEGADESALDDIFNANPGYPAGKEFLDGVKDGTYDLDEEFGVFFDREMPTAYTDNPAMLDYVDLEEGGFNGLMRQTGRSYTSARGEQLKDFTGALAPTIDPFETVDRALTNVANLSSFSDYKLVALERWSTTFKPYLNYKDGASDYEVFANGIIKPGTDSKIINAMMAQKAAVERNLGWKSDGARRWEQETRKFAEWVIGDDPTKIRTKVLTKVGDWVSETDPLNALRGFAFDMKLGFFNPVQWPLQIQTSVAALTLDPANGMKGMFSYPFVRTYLRKGGGEHDLDFMVKNGHHKLMGFESVGEFKLFMRDIKQSGWLVVNNTHAMINDYGVNVATDTANNLFSTVREKGRFFFHEAEIMNRTVARRIAWDRVQKMGITDPAEFDRTLAGLSEDYAFNMTRESGAAWQQGLMSIPTQFWSYNARMLEAMFSNKFTPAQRARLVIGQGILYGSAGVPGASMIMNWQNTQDGHVDEANTVAGLIDRGLYDWALTNAFGTDLSVGARLGTGDFIPGLLADIFGMSQYGEKSPIEMVVGATGSIGAQTGTPLIDIIHQIGMYSQGESGGELTGDMTEKSFKELMLNVSSLSNASKAYFVFKYGTYMSNSGNTQASGMPSSSAVAIMLFGAKPGEALQTEAMFAYKGKRDESVKDAVKVISQYRTRFVNEPENREEITRQINLFTKMLPPDIRKAAIQKVQRDPDKSIYESLHRQVEKLKAEKERMASVGNSN